MSTMQVTIVLLFDRVEPGSPDDERIINEITEECERIRIGFDASNCWVDDAKFIE